MLVDMRDDGECFIETEAVVGWTQEGHLLKILTGAGWLTCRYCDLNETRAAVDRGSYITVPDYWRMKNARDRLAQALRAEKMLLIALASDGEPYAGHGADAAGPASTDGPCTSHSAEPDGTDPQ
jgi:hypothetical protein